MMVIDVFLIAVFAWIFIDVLEDEDMILYPWYRLIKRFPDWVSKPLGACEYCFGGQVAMWYYIYAYHASYSLISHVIYISSTIFIIRLLNKIFYGN